MSLVKWTIIGLLVLPAAELFAFFLVAALIGWFWAAGLFIATSIVGVLLLRRFGRADLGRLRTAFARDGIRALHLDARRNPSDISRFYNGPLGRRVVAARGSPVGRGKTRDVRAQFPAYPARRSRHRA